MKWWRGGTMASLLTVCESESSFFFFFLKRHFATITLWCQKLQATSVSFRVQFVWSICFLHNVPVFRWKWRQSNTGDGTKSDWSEWEIMHHQPLGGSTIKAHQTAAGNLHILMSKNNFSRKVPHWLKQQESTLFYRLGSEVQGHILPHFESEIWKSVLFFSSTMSIFYSQLFSFMRKQESNDWLQNNTDNTLQKCLKKINTKERRINYFLVWQVW